MSLLIIVLTFLPVSLCLNVVNVPEGREEIFVQDAVVPQLDGRIVGGFPVNISDHPYQVSFQNWHQHTCGGVLISAEWVVTAAHCIGQGGVHRYSFRLSSHLWAQGGTVILILEMIPHPQYTSSTLDYDIGLIRIQPVAEVEGLVGYAKLPPLGWTPMPGATSVVSGWGTPFSGGSLMAELQAVKVPIVSNESCLQYYRVQFPNVLVTDRMVCAGFVAGGYDACQGDSGGPLMVDEYLTGIVSWGFGCATPGFPGVYASVPNLLPWIKEQTGL